MRLVFGLVLLLGVGLAGFAVYMAQGYVSQYEAALEQERAAASQQVATTEIYVAAQPLRYGDVLTPEHVKKIKFPLENLPEGSFLEEAALFPEENARPRMVIRAMEINEPLLQVKVTEPGREAGVATFLADGMRAFTINVDVTSGVSGFLSPGDRVDVFWSGNSNGRDITQLIQSSVLIIAIDQSADQDRTAPAIARTVTVQVSPQQVASLAQAQATGRLSLALVGVADTTQVSGIEVDQSALLGIEEAAPVVQQQEERCTIRQGFGATATEIEIPCNN